MFPLVECANAVRFGLSRLASTPTSNLTSGIFRNFSSNSFLKTSNRSVAQQTSTLPALTPAGNVTNSVTGGCGDVNLVSSVRTIIRVYWPRPRERKRHQLGWKARMSTPGGRAVIMRRILKGRFVLTH